MFSIYNAVSVSKTTEIGDTTSNESSTQEMSVTTDGAATVPTNNSTDTLALTITALFLSG